MSTAFQRQPAVRPTFVGRAREIASISAALEDAHAGRGSLLLLMGDAGAGKTRIAEEAAALAARRGFRVWWGRCHDERGMPPCWPWSELLRACLRDAAVPDAVLSAGATGGADELLVDSQLPSGRETERSHRSHDSARFHLFDAVAGVFERAATHAPILGIIEDLHWADDASIALLAFVSRRVAHGRVLLLGTSRADVRFGADGIAPNLAGPVARSLPLDGLGRDEVDALFTAVSRRHPDSALLAAVHRQTAGNPFFVTEIARWMQSADAAGGQGELPVLRIPGTVWSVIRQRLDRLSPESRATMRLASAFGGEFDPALLEDVCDDVERKALAATLAQASAEHVICVGHGGSLAFRHPLIRQALYEELAPGLREDVHARIASAYVRAESADDNRHVSEIAHHLSRAGRMADAGSLARYSQLAGAQAFATHAYTEAVAHFERALAAAADSSVDPDTADIHLGLGRALAAASLRWNRQTAWKHLSRTAELYLRRGSIAQAVQVVVDASLLPESVSRMSATIARVRQHVHPDSAEAGWLHARGAAAIYFESGDYDRATAEVAHATSLAERTGDIALELRALSFAASMDHFALRWENLLGKCQRVVDLARRIDDPHAETYVRYRAAYVLAFEGEPAEARLHARFNIAQAEHLADPGLLADALFAMAVLAQFEGDWTGARHFAARGLAVSPDHLPLLQMTVALEFETGRVAEGRRQLNRLGDAATRAGPYPLRTALHTLALAQIADLAPEGARHSRLADGAMPSARAEEAAHIAMAAMLGEWIPQALAAIRAGDPERAAAWLDRLEPYAGKIPATPLLMDNLLGRLAAVAGDDLRANRFFEQALVFCRRAAYRPLLAWTCHDYARFLLDGGRAYDRERASALVTDAGTLAADLDMQPLMRRIDVLRHALREAGNDRPDGLTPRELEILRLIAAGRSNKAIAKQLDISRNTVAVHVSRILAKTGACNRTEAARYAHVVLGDGQS